MAPRNSICLLLMFLATTYAYTVSYLPHSRGRKLFGGYRIVPKVCQPTNPSTIKSDQPAVCMFNYECSRRNGEVVGACMDGFLFGACCQLPIKQANEETMNKGPSTEDLLNLHEIDHVPDIPILLNPDGTPVGMDTSGSTSTKTASNTKTSSSTIVPPHHPGHYTDTDENAAKPQVPSQVDFSHLEQDFPVLLDQQGILDDLRLPGLLTHSDSNNDIQGHQDTSAINPVTTLLSPDQVLQIADPVDQLPALFSQGLSHNNHSMADTILLNEYGATLNETHNPDELFKPNIDGGAGTHEKKPIQNKNGSSQTISSSSMTQGTTGEKNQAPTHKITASTWLPSVTQKISSTEKPSAIIQMSTSSMAITSNQKTSVTTKPVFTASTGNLRVSSGSSTLRTESTTPMSTTIDKKEELIRVPTITYDAQSGNKKDDVLDHEEISINHIISILNDTTSISDAQVISQNNSPIHTWISVDETSKPSIIKLSSLKPSRRPSARPSIRPSTTTTEFPYTFYKPGQATYYNYESVPTEATGSSSNPQVLFPNTYSSRPSGTQGTFDTSSLSYSTRPSTNPPAPTVIVLGPLGTEFTTATTQKTSTRRPVGSTKPGVTKKPSGSTTITHNISTFISTSNTASNDNHVVSTSYISVNLKDSTSSKPSVSQSQVTPGAIITNDDTDYELVTTKNPNSVTKRPTTMWTTLSSWSEKPSFHLKPSNPNFNWPQDNTNSDNTIVLKDPVAVDNIITMTSPSPCEEETAAPNDLINFPPVRNPNLNFSVSASQQEKPTLVETFNNTGYPDIELVSENEIPTPAFIEDDVLTNKVDVFVNKIVESLQENFDDLKDVVYNKRNTSLAPTSAPTVTRRPTTSSPAVSTTRKPVRRPTQTSKPSQFTTKRPVTTRRPPTRLSSTTVRPVSGDRPVRPGKPTTTRPRPTTPHSVTTKRPQTTTRRTKPTRKPTVPTVAVIEDTEEEEVPSTSVILSTTTEKATFTSDFKKECGIRPQLKSGRIVGGKRARFGEWPWQVLVREATWLGLFTKNKCGGVLITNKYVVTAAHCQPGFLASLVAVFGEFDISGELEPKRSVSRNVRRVIVNRGYDPATFENDLALLELETPIQFDTHIVPICMPDDDADFTGRMATVTGWGRLKYKGAVPSVLQEVQVPIMENSVCQEMFQIAEHPKRILDSFLCAGYANGQKDSCEGDSGGPLVMERPDGRWVLVGTVSHGIKCAAPYLPGVYMKTTFFKPWLHSITGV